mgnify:CR=1 FL=1
MKQDVVYKSSMKLGSSQGIALASVGSDSTRMAVKEFYSPEFASGGLSMIEGAEASG